RATPPPVSSRPAGRSPPGRRWERMFSSVAGAWNRTAARVTTAPVMGEWFLLDADPAHVAREREKARALRKSAWWQRRLSRGICAYCEQRFSAAELTMD